MSNPIISVVDPRITFLVNQDYVSIELYDYTSNLTLFSLELTPEQFTQALSRLAFTEVKKLEVNTFAVDNLNKNRLMDSFNFVTEVKQSNGLRDEEIYKLAVEFANEHYPGWIVQNYFGSKGQVQLVNDKYLVKVNIFKYE